MNILWKSVKFIEDLFQKLSYMNTIVDRTVNQIIWNLEFNVNISISIIRL